MCCHAQADSSLKMQYQVLASPSIAALVHEQWLQHHKAQKQPLLSHCKHLGGFPGTMFEQQGHKLFRYGDGVKLTLFELQRPPGPSDSGACPSAIESQPRKLQRDFAGGGAEDPMPADQAAQAAAGGGPEDPMPANQAAQVAAGDVAQDAMPVDQAAQAADSVDLCDEGSDLESHHFHHSVNVPGNIGSTAVVPGTLPTLDAQQDSATQLMQDLAARLRGPLLDAAVFKIVEGKAPGGQWSGTGRVVVLASSNDDSYRRYAKGG